MSEAEDARPFYEEQWFRGAAAVLGVAGVVFGLVGPPKLWDVIADLFSDDLPPSNTEIVLDASAGMGVPFGGGEGETKLSAAARAVASYVVPHANESFALRPFGGGCDDAGDLLVGFGAEHGDDLSEAARGLAAAGKSNAANAVLAAIDDYSDAGRFPPERTFSKRIVVFTGTADECSGESAAEIIRRRLEGSRVKLDFTFVGVAIPEDERERLRLIAGELESPAIFADTDEELAEVVEYLEIEPVIADGETAREIHNTVIEKLNDFIAALNGGDLQVAEKALRESDAALEETNDPYERIGARQARDAFTAIYDLLGRARAIQGELIVLGETLLDLRRELEEDGNQAEYENALAEWNGVIDRQLENRDLLQEAQSALVELLPPVEG
jgi:hypothetical protein